MGYYIFEFIIIAVLSYGLYYYIFMKKNNKKSKEPIEFNYLTAKYKINMKKIDSKKLRRLMSLCNALIISTTILLLEFIDSLGLKMLIGFVVLMALTIGTYHLIGKHYQKKGMTK